MKKCICLIVVCLLLCGCGYTGGNSSLGEVTPVQPEHTKKTVGAWITFSELNSMLNGAEPFETAFENALSRLEELSVNCLYVHVRAFADAYYKSSLFPTAAACRNLEIDALEIMVNAAHMHNMQFIAWINPYRISTATNNPETIDAKLLSQLTNQDICTAGNGLYLNPGSMTVRKLVIDGVREIVVAYNVDGIHFDDYFYPTPDPLFDADTYSSYCNTAGTALPLADWRRANVNSLISGTYAAVKAENSNLVFSVSPTANIEQNYGNLYADVKAWAQGGYVDEIIPQLYFGFEYPNVQFRFENLVSSWQEYLGDTSVRVLIGLAAYKIDSKATADIDEWQSREDIIARQIKYLENSPFKDGYVFFSYSSLCGDSERQTAQRNHILQ